MRKPHGTQVEPIMQALKDYGPMTMAEISDTTGIDWRIVSRVVGRLVTRTPKAGKRAYIKAYVYDHEGERMYPRAVYALGDKDNASKPKRDRNAVVRRWYAKRQAKTKVNSVFNIGMSAVNWSKWERKA